MWWAVSVAVWSLAAAGCRDRLKQPFSSDSIWNTAIGSSAVYIPAALFNGSNVSTALRRTAPPIPQLHKPLAVYVDTDYFIVTSESDPATPVVGQGWHGSDPLCAANHCCQKPDAPTLGTLPFPKNWTTRMTGNNNAAVLLPDNQTVVQWRFFMRCARGGNILATNMSNVSILGDGRLGAHAGSGLSSLGGTLRRGELLPTAGPIPHALKLLLFGKDYYWRGNDTIPCYRWPATQCDSDDENPTTGYFYNGKNPALKPGTLLAIPPGLAASLAPSLKTVVAAKILAALTDFGGYLDEDATWAAAAFTVEGGVVEEVASAYGGLSLQSLPGEAFYEDMLAVFQQLHIVDNNGNASIGGGGSPRQPPAPPICSPS